MTYHLYVKTHNKTGLKYLGRTGASDPHKYQGSGSYWKRHILQHGYNVTTDIIGTYSTIEELRKIGLYYSKLWNIVESDEWANLMEEAGDGIPIGHKHSLERKNNMSLAAKNKPKSTEHRKHMSESQLIAQNKPENRERRILGLLRANKRPGVVGRRNIAIQAAWTPELKERQRLKVIGRIWITNGIINKRVPKQSELEWYSKGFRKGQIRL